MPKNTSLIKRSLRDGILNHYSICWWQQCWNPTEMSRNANTSTIIIANTHWRYSSTDAGSLSSRTASWRFVPVPRIHTSSPQQVIGLVGKAKLRDVCLDEGDHSTLFDAADEWPILLYDLVCPHSATNSGTSPSHLDVVLDWDRNSEQRRQIFLGVGLVVHSPISLTALLSFLVTSFSSGYCVLEVILSQRS